MQKKTFFVTIGTALFLTIGFLFYSSCNKVDENMGIPENTSSKKPSASGMVPKSGGGLGYLDENDVFRPIADTWLKDYYREILQLGDMELEAPTIIDETDPETGNPLYLLMIASTDGTLRITEPLDRHGDAHYIIRGSTCSCKSISCSVTYGCNASVVAGDCKCSDCKGDCKKKTITTSKLFIQEFFNAYYALAE